jgi:uncharacterized protein (DUF1330 family)
MAKGYWMAHVRVSDAGRYGAYVEGARAAFEAHGARFLARGGAFEELEGALGRERHVLIEFESLEAARACWASDAYQAARAHRLPVSEATIVVAGGVEPPADPPGGTPGYWIGHVAVTDPAAYARYREANAAPFARHGARFLVRGGASEELEGALGRERHVVIAFPDHAAALACWASDGYAAARAERAGAGIASIVAVEGLAD